MEVGRLNRHATILALGADLTSVVIGKAWLGIKAKEDADPGIPTGLRSPARVSIRGRFSAKLTQGRYLAYGGRLFYITSARDPVGDRTELRVTADEFIGEPAMYRPEGGPDRPCRVLLTFDAPYRDEFGKVVEYRTKAEVALIETGRVQADELLQVGGTVYSVLGYADETDDGVVRGVWLQAMEV